MSHQVREARLRNNVRAEPRAVSTAYLLVGARWHGAPCVCAHVYISTRACASLKVSYCMITKTLGKSPGDPSSYWIWHLQLKIQVVMIEVNLETSRHDF